jgi:transcriptional regulator with XRE-family HTH domain
MTQAQLAAGLGLSPGRVSQLKRQGMPVADLEAAQEWLRLNVTRDDRRALDLPAEAVPLDMGPHARLQRAQEGERRHFALWEAAVARRPLNSREVSELATSWREMRKGAAEAEKELSAFLLATKKTMATSEAVSAFRNFMVAVVQDFSTHPWGDKARAILNHHLAQGHEVFLQTNKTTNV